MAHINVSRPISQLINWDLRFKNYLFGSGGITVNNADDTATISFINDIYKAVCRLQLTNITATDLYLLFNKHQDAAKTMGRIYLKSGATLNIDTKNKFAIEQLDIEPEDPSPGIWGLIVTAT